MTLPTDAITDERCVRFVMTSYFLVDGCAYSRSFRRFFVVSSVIMFSSANKNDASTSLGGYF